MPLIITCGVPCSGKSTFVDLLVTSLQSRYPDNEFLVLREPPLTGNVEPDGEFKGPDWRCPVYADSKNERELRGRHKSEVERALTRRGLAHPLVVVMDAPNYIKGYRYELYCLAKSLKHPNVVLFCDTPTDTCRKWNQEISRYPPELLDDMVNRMELPISTNRWDSPLITVRTHLYPKPDAIDVSSVVHELGELLFQPGRGSSVKPNRSTQLANISPTDFLQDLERSIQLIVDHVLCSISIGAETVGLPDSLARSVPGMGDLTSQDTQLRLVGRERELTTANLARAKRRYITLQKAKLANVSRTPSAVSVACGFLRYLSSTGSSDN